jgi:hypothetical protein
VFAARGWDTSPLKRKQIMHDDGLDLWLIGSRVAVVLATIAYLAVMLGWIK